MIVASAPVDQNEAHRQRKLQTTNRLQEKMLEKLEDRGEGFRL